MSLVTLGLLFVLLQLNTDLFIFTSGLYKCDRKPGEGEGQNRDLTLLSHSWQLLIVPWSLGFFIVHLWCRGCCWKVCKGVAQFDFRRDNEGSDLCVSLPAWPDNGSAKCGTMAVQSVLRRTHGLPWGAASQWPVTVLRLRRDPRQSQSPVVKTSEERNESYCLFGV